MKHEEHVLRASLCFAFILPSSNGFSLSTRVGSRLLPSHLLRHHRPHHHCAAQTQLWSRGGDFDDFSTIGDSDDAPDAEGEALARAFYQQLRQRKEADGEEEKTRSTPTSTSSLSEQQARSLNREAFGRRREVIAGRDGPSSDSAASSSSAMPAARRKFTGNNSPDLPSSAGLFSGRGASVYSIPSSSPRQRMMRNELDLAGRAEKSLLIQILATLGMLSLGIYVGLTGGIDANDWTSVTDSLDTTIEGMEGIIPLPSDTETSVWL